VAGDGKETPTGRLPVVVARATARGNLAGMGTSKAVAKCG